MPTNTANSVLTPAKLQADREAAENLIENRLLRPVGLPEVELRHGSHHIVGETRQKRPVQSHFLGELFHRLRRRIRSENETRRIAGCQIHDCEDDEGNAQHNRDQQEQALEYVFCHSFSFPPYVCIAFAAAGSRVRFAVLPVNHVEL